MEFEDDNTIDFTHEPVEQSGINFSAASAVPLSKEQITQRALKNKIALGADGPDVKSIEDAISRGDEDSIRELAVSNDFVKQKALRFQMAQEFVAKGGDMSDEERNALMNFGTDPKALDHNIALEQEYAQNMTDFFLANEDPEQAAEAPPQQKTVARDIAVEFITKAQVAQRNLEDVIAQNEENNIVQRTLFFLDTMIPFWNWYNIQNASGKDLGGFLSGENQQRVYDNLWSLPPNEFAEQSGDIIRRLYSVNPNFAIQFAQGLVGYTSDQNTMDNVWSVFDLATAVPISKLGQLFKGTKASKTAKTAQVVDGSGKYISDAERLKDGWKIVTEGEGKRVLTDEELVQKGWSIQEAGKVPSDAERLAQGWDVGDVDFKAPPEAEQLLKNSTTSIQYSVDDLTKKLKAGQDDLINLSDDLVSQAGNALQNGGKITLTIDGRKVEITQIIDGMMADAQGQRWGILPLLQNKTKKGPVFSIEMNSASNTPGISGFKDFIKGQSMANKKPEEVLDSMGLSEEAADVGALNRAAKEAELQQAVTSPDAALKLDPEFRNHNFDVLVRQTPSLSNPNRFLDDIGHATAEGERRLYNLLKKNIELAKDAFQSPFRVLRGTEAAIDFGLADAKAQIARIYDRPVDAIIDFRDVRPEETVDNVGYVEATIGRKDGTFFKTKRAATNYASKYLGITDNHSVVPNGGGWVVKVRKAIDETTEGYRNALIQGDNKAPPNSLARFLPGTSAKDKFTSFMNEQRASAVSGSQRLSSIMREIGRPLEDLTRGERESLNRIMEQNRDFVSPKDPSVRGKFFNNVGELDAAYMSTFRRMPSNAEREAYFTAVQLNDIEYLLHNFAISNFKKRLGYGKVTLGSADNGFSFEGKFLDEIPWDGADDFTVAVVDTTGKSKVYRKSRLVGGAFKLIQERLEKDGFKIIQVFNPRDDAIREVFNTRGKVNFVVVKRASYTDLDWQQVSYAPGFHSQYKSSHYGKQAILEDDGKGGFAYVGDATAMGFENGAKASKFVKALEDARQLLLKGDDVALKRFLEENLPQEWDLATFKQKFEPVVDSAGKVIRRAQFQKNTPFVVTRSGQNTLDSGVTHNGKGLAELFPGIRQSAEDVYDDYAKLDQRFLSERNPVLDSVVEGSSEGKPVYSIGGAEQIDPMTMIQNSMGTMIQSRYFQDLQIVSAESFVETFADVILDKAGKAYSRAELRRNPIAATTDAVIDKSGDPKRARQAEGIRRATLNLLGTPNSWDGQVARFKEALKSEIYTRFGNTPADKWLSNAELPNVTDGIRFAKNVAFHTKLGLFNPVQIFVQGQTLANINLIAGPARGGKAVATSTLMRQLDLTKSPEVIEHYSKLAAKVGGMTPEQFQESYRWLKETGFDIVGQDYAWRGDIFEDKVFQGAGQKFLEKGTMFFSGTERFVRMSAWNAAYLEAIEANPRLLGKMGLKDAQKILSRAGDLSGNMTKDANAFWQEKGFAPFTQFFSYQARMLDLMIGKRLTPKEKFKLMAGFGALYGVGAPMGVALPFFNPYEDIRQGFIDQGIDVNDGVMGYIMNGIPAMLMSAAIGSQPNIGERYGPMGLNVLNDLRKEFQDDEDKFDAFLSLLTVSGGASGSITSDILADGWPMMKSAYGWLNDENSLGVFVADLERVSKNVSSINAGSKMIMALEGGKYISKNGTLLTDNVSPHEAVIYGVTGLQPQEISDAFGMVNSMKSWKAHEAAVQKEATRLMKLYVQARDKGDTDSMTSYDRQLRALFASSGFSATQKQRLLSRAISEDTMTKSVVKKWLETGDPEQLRQRRRMIIERERQSQ